VHGPAAPLHVWDAAAAVEAGVRAAKRAGVRRVVLLSWLFAATGPAPQGGRAYDELSWHDAVPPELLALASRTTQAALSLEHDDDARRAAAAESPGGGGGGGDQPEGGAKAAGEERSAAAMAALGAGEVDAAAALLAEQTAWRASLMLGLDVVTILPARLLLGPLPHAGALVASAPGVRAAAALLAAAPAATCAGGWRFVSDARDVAAAAIAAAMLPQAAGRFLTTAQAAGLTERQLATALQAAAAAARHGPDAAAAAAAAALAAGDGRVRRGGAPISLSAPEEAPRADLRKAVRELQYRPRPLAETLADTAASLERWSLVGGPVGGGGGDGGGDGRARRGSLLRRCCVLC